MGPEKNGNSDSTQTMKSFRNNRRQKQFFQWRENLFEGISSIVRKVKALRSTFERSFHYLCSKLSCYDTGQPKKGIERRPIRALNNFMLRQSPSVRKEKAKKTPQWLNWAHQTISQNWNLPSLTLVERKMDKTKGKFNLKIKGKKKKKILWGSSTHGPSLLFSIICLLDSADNLVWGEA